MKTDSVKEVIRIIKTEPLSVLFFLSLIFLPFIISQWSKLFPQSWEVFVVVIIIILWVIAFFRLRGEIKIWRKKTILINYLKKERRHSINHLTKEWGGRKEFTEKDIEKLLSEFPDELKRVKMGNNKGEGISLTTYTPEKS